MTRLADVARGPFFSFLPFRVRLRDRRASGGKGEKKQNNASPLPPSHLGVPLTNARARPNSAVDSLIGELSDGRPRFPGEATLRRRPGS